jgi:hypothetical protein
MVPIDKNLAEIIPENRYWLVVIHRLIGLLFAGYQIASDCFLHYPIEDLIRLLIGLIDDAVLKVA